MLEISMHDPSRTLDGTCRERCPRICNGFEATRGFQPSASTACVNACGRCSPSGCRANRESPVSLPNAEHSGRHDRHGKSGRNGCLGQRIGHGRRASVSLSEKRAWLSCLPIWASRASCCSHPRANREWVAEATLLDSTSACDEPSHEVVRKRCSSHRRNSAFEVGSSLLRNVSQK